MGDCIDLSDAINITGFGDLMNNHVQDNGPNLVITTDDGPVLVLRGIDAEDRNRAASVLRNGGRPSIPFHQRG